MPAWIHWYFSTHQLQPKTCLLSMSVHRGDLATASTEAGPPGHIVAHLVRGGEGAKVWHGQVTYSDSCPFHPLRCQTSGTRAVICRGDSVLPAGSLTHGAWCAAALVVMGLEIPEGSAEPRGPVPLPAFTPRRVAHRTNFNALCCGFSAPCTKQVIPELPQRTTWLVQPYFPLRQCHPSA